METRDREEDIKPTEAEKLPTFDELPPATQQEVIRILDKLNDLFSDDK